MTTSPDSTRRVSFCTGCGTPAGDARFCTGCGQPLQGAAPAQRAESEAAQTVVRPLSAPTPAAPEPPPLPTWQVATPPTVVAPSAPRRPTRPSPPPLPSPEPALLDDLAGDGYDDGYGDHGYDEPGDDEQAPPVAPRRRTGLLVAAGLIALLTIGAAAALFVLRVNGGPARDALQASASDVTSVVRAFSTARDLDGVVTAAGAAGPAAERVEGQLAALGSSEGDLERVAGDQLRAEVELLEALAGLAALKDEPLEQWGAQQGPLEDAVRAESRARSALLGVDDAAAADRPDTGAMLSRVTAAVGGALAEDAAGRGGELLTTLGAAATTAEVRAAADTANTERPAVQSVLPSLSGDDGKAALEAYDAVLVALGGLSRLDGESTDVWDGARAELSTSFGRLAAASPAAGDLATRTPQVLAALDQLVERAATAMAEYRTAYDAAVAARDADTAALAAYRADVAVQVEQYDVLRSDGQSFFDRVRAGGVDEYDAFSALSSSADARRALRGALTDLRVPTGMAAAHDRLVAVVTRSIGAMDSATSVLAGSTCFDACAFTAGHPAYAAFQSANEGISEEYSAAVTAWGAAAEAAGTEISTRALPVRPQV